MPLKCSNRVSQPQAISWLTLDVWVFLVSLNDVICLSEVYVRSLMPRDELLSRLLSSSCLQMTYADTTMIHCKNNFRIMHVNDHTADIYYHMSVIHHVQMLLTKDTTLPIWLRHTVLFVREKYYLIPRNFIVLAVENMYTETVVGF